MADSSVVIMLNPSLDMIKALYYPAHLPLVITRRQRVSRHGDSDMLVIPAALVKGKEATLAAGRLMLVDPRGEISEAELGRLLESLIEPALHGAVVVVQPTRAARRTAKPEG